MTRDATEALERLEAIVDSAVDGILTIDEKGIILSANRAAERIFAMTKAELVGGTVNRLMPSPYREEHDGYLRRFLETGEAKIIGIGREVTGLRSDGTTFPLDLAVSEGWHDGERLFTGIVRDLSDLRGAEERARAAEQLASLSVITAGIAHDIGTPMNVILGYADMLRDALDDPKDRRRAEIISEQVRRVTDLIETLLNIARPQRSERVPLRLPEVLDHALDFFREKLRARGVTVDREYGDVPEVHGDRDRLEQVFLNLIVNASDAMPRGGRLRVSVALFADADHTRNAESTANGSNANPTVSVEIEDTGTGIEPEALERIFEPFHTTKARGEGTGLGLVVARSIVADHGGSIDVESEVGKGTRFEMRFPIAASERD